MIQNQAKAAEEFYDYWKDHTYEKGESQPFWLSLLRDVYGVEHPERYISFEKQVKMDHTSFIDGYIADTKVLIEQKGADRDLREGLRQSDGSFLTPYQQAMRYIMTLPVSQHPRWVITCNFKSFMIYDMEAPGGEPEELLLEKFPKEYYRLDFLVNKHSDHIQEELDVSVAAGEIVGKLYDAFLAQYPQPVSDQDLHSLNVLCVRLVFCLYAENGGIFGSHTMFHDYLEDFDTRHIRKALEDLFETLDQPEEERPKHLKDDDPKRAAFPYVNGGLFSRKEEIDIPPFTDEIRDLLLEQASAGFDWSGISPTIFGAVFESTLNPETRRSGGMHYTSVENIHKVIDPLFLDDLTAEFSEIQQIEIEKTRKRKLQDFQKKLASLTFLDPACGSGNFLTETYLCLRRLENDVLRELSDQITMGDIGFSPIQVTLDQFFGIEVNDFAVSVAMTALWIAESQMMQQTEDIVHSTLDFLPLTANNGIRHGNALRMDWNDVVSSYKLDYIMGNPPFVGNNNQNDAQREDMQIVLGGKGKVLDYVAGWYFKAAQIMSDTTIRTAFVSTNSITQGEQVSGIWEPLFNEYHIHIDFAYRTFHWDSEASTKAQVYCVIIGMASDKSKPVQKRIYDGSRVQNASNINGYLMDAPNIFIQSRKHPICDVFEIRKGDQPTDGGNLIIEASEIDDFLRREPDAKPYIKKLVGAKEYINRTPRYCLWLVGIQPAELRKMPLVMERVERVREMRLKSPDAGTRRLANTPTVFRETNNPNSFIIIPSATSSNRRYVPMGFMGGDTIATNLVLIIPDATVYYLGILTSNVHMAWMRAVCGRLGDGYRYSKEIVYNNFPWPDPSPEQKAKIEQTAQGILDARALYPDSSLADLYDEFAMPPELRKAHQENDRAVMQAYGFSIRDTTESSCVAELMKMYQQIVEAK